MTEDERTPDFPETERELPRGSTSRDWSTDFHVQRWQTGDGGGFLALEDHFERLLLSRVRRSSAWPELARHHRAEDVMRSVMARAFKRGEKPFAASGEGSFLAMLRRLCDRTLDELLEERPARRRGRGDGGGYAVESAVSDDHAGDSGAVGDGGDDEELAALARWLLSEEEYLAWQHVDREGYSTEEVGDLVLDCSAAAVGERLARARAELDQVG